MVPKVLVKGARCGSCHCFALHAIQDVVSTLVDLWREIPELSKRNEMGVQHWKDGSPPSQG